MTPPRCSSCSARRVLVGLHSLGVLMQAFGFTRAGEPKHPLYLRRDAALVKVAS